MEKLTDEVKELITKHFQELRKKQGLSYQKLGDKAFAGYEDTQAKALNTCRNKIKSLDIDTLIRIAIALNESPTDVFTRFYHQAKDQIDSRVIKTSQTKAPKKTAA